ncbi:glycerate kinase [Paenibacillus aceris]|uniref:Glycerate kinase n=1 Tax=Paenibacillus aceris TaxID=869555 RepID=A0ABS4I5Q3_9BACL|nr:glycerate kinase [Paenibacillus aceris]MBP1966158.1 glycerate kinase [Paenibacillus aceris]NHW33313.1 glycerate kinase [Paenibacillus aceris]
MKIIIAPDSFKGSISAADAAIAIQKGIKRCLPQAETILVPVADGGEGTLDSLTRISCNKVSTVVTGPLGNPISAEYGILHGGTVGVIELASASGLELLEKEELDPLHTTTYGTGELIRHALDAGCRHFILAIGGSATNDGGAGILQALGVRLLDEAGCSVGSGGGELQRIVSIDDSGLDARIAESTFIIASDVQNPMLGPNGATHIFGPQKGATPQLIEKLEQGMSVWADRIADKTGIRVHDLPGAGAAGGVGGVLLGFFKAQMKRGIDIVIAQSGLRDHLVDADLVITGEGRIDSQTASGKTPMGIAQEAQKFGVPAIALAGSIGPGIEALYSAGILSVHSIINGPMTLEEAMSRSSDLLELAAEQVMRTYRLSTL